MTPAEDELTQGEKRETLRQDARQRWGFSSTYHERTAAELQTPGRFGALGQPQITGQSAGWPKMPEGNPWAGPPDLHNIGRTDEEIARDELRRKAIAYPDPNPAQGVKTQLARDPGGAPSALPAGVAAPPSSPKGQR